MLREAEVSWKFVAGTLAGEGIEWRLFPLSAPHFGGLWEAAVKSAKSHMKRIIGQRVLTYEEMTTFVSQVEMCLNSRPLTPLTGDVDDFSAVTPNHFLTGYSLSAPRSHPAIMRSV